MKKNSESGPYAEADSQAYNAPDQQKINASEQGVWTVNRDGKTTYVNQLMADILGCSINEILGYPLWKFMNDINASDEEKNSMRCARTGLPSRSLFFDRLYRAMERRQRKENYQYSLLFVDLDRFRIINESLGYDAGNDVLRRVAERLSGCLRTVDTVTWFGRDEYIVLLEDISSHKDALRVVDRIRNKFSQPFHIREHEIFISISIGIVYSAPEYKSPHQMIGDAETAMYRAKAEGVNQYRVFNSKMHKQATERLNMETDLRKAIDRKEFVLHYQPIVDLVTEEIVGIEALVRWNHPVKGMISPVEFIPIAEDTGLIVPIGTWVLREACDQIVGYIKEMSLKGPFILGLNVSVIQLLQGDLIDEIQKIIDKTGIDPECLKLEVTESVMMDNADAMIPLFEKLKKTGIRLVVDDFGTGYSSLSYLQQFPFDTLKIDRSFVEKLGPDEDKHIKIIQTIISLAFHLDMNVIAEGIEKKVQIERLRELNCQYGQGFYFSKPLELEPLKKFHNERIIGINTDHFQ
ncbi:sensor domain-containing phosphodiesterase [Desulfococcaceae bacterium HSG8]|nr:sensor domain-containing phosphodiesterase [Desulfococcaceae bacterium HSG8]